MSASFGDSHSLIDISISLRRNALELRPAWVAVAGALAAGFRFESRSLVLGFMLIFLVDPLWGGLWRISMKWPGDSKRGRRPFWSGWRLPYRVPGAPADVLYHLVKKIHLSESYDSGLLESMLVALSFAVVVSFVVGKVAVIATMIVFLLSAVAAVVKGSKRTVALLAGLVFFAAPFYLAQNLLGFPSKEAIVLGALWFPVYVFHPDLDFKGSRLLLIIPSTIAAVYFLWLHAVFGAVLISFSTLPIIASEEDGGKVPFYLLLSLMLSSLMVGYGL